MWFHTTYSSRRVRVYSTESVHYRIELHYFGQILFRLPYIGEITALAYSLNFIDVFNIYYHVTNRTILS